MLKSAHAETIHLYSHDGTARSIYMIAQHESFGGAALARG